MDNREKTLTILKQLYTVNEKAAEGFREAAEVAEMDELQTLFYANAQNRSEYAAAIADHIRHMGGDPEQSTLTSVASEVHQLWMQARGTFGDGDESLIKSVLEGEQQAKAAYDYAHEEELPDDIHDTLHAHHIAIKQDMDRLENLANLVTA